MAEAFPYQLDEFYLDLKDGESTIALLTPDEIQSRPFPGLRPYKTSEFQLFKGRGGQAEELINRLKNHNFLAVIGSSGTGKSSLVRAGLIPQLLGGYLYKTGNKWDIAVCRPGKNPIENLSIALSCVSSASNDKENILRTHQETEPKLDGSLYGILDVKNSFTWNTDTEGRNLLIIVDQFEELFRFDRKDLGRDNIETHFVNLLLKATSIPNNSVYVIITMRSEFLGDCVKYRGLPEAINEAQYLVPQLSRAQLKEVIEGPILLAGKKIATGLVELLINEIEEGKLKENLDQLPIMQHALMRTYNKAIGSGADTEISYEHYKAVGGMEKALANHAEAKFNELGDEVNDISVKQKIAKLVFQAITDLSTDAKGGRRPTDLQNIYDIAEPLEQETTVVDEVINHFRDSDTSFIMPLINTALYPNLVIDISHESLMRNWELLNTWITEEVTHGKLYKLLNERRELFEQNIDGYLKGGLLTEIMEWEEKFHDSAAWAKRYNQKNLPTLSPDQNKEIYTKNIDFLLKSFNERNAEQEKEKEEFKERIDRATREKGRKTIFRILATGIIVSFGLAIFGVVQARKNYRLAREYKKQLLISDSLSQLAMKREVQAAKYKDSILSYQNALTEKQVMFARHYAKEEKIIADSIALENQKIKSAMQKQY